VDRVLPLRTTLLRCFFTRESEDLSTATFRRGPLLEDSRRGVCWRVGFPVCCFPPCGVSPRGVWGLCPLRSSDDAVSMILSPHPEPTSGCSEPDSGWQSAAARPGTTLSVPAPGRPPDHHQHQLYGKDQIQADDWLSLSAQAHEENHNPTQAPVPAFAYWGLTSTGSYCAQRRAAPRSWWCLYRRTAAAPPAEY